MRWLVFVTPHLITYQVPTTSGSKITSYRKTTRKMRLTRDKEHPQFENYNRSHRSVTGA